MSRHCQSRSKQSPRAILCCNFLASFLNCVYILRRMVSGVSTGKKDCRHIAEAVRNAGPQRGRSRRCSNTASQKGIQPRPRKFSSMADKSTKSEERIKSLNRGSSLYASLNLNKTIVMFAVVRKKKIQRKNTNITSMARANRLSKLSLRSPPATTPFSHFFPPRAG